MENEKVTIADFNKLFIEWGEYLKSKGIRFGQAFCNKFDITDQDLFYDENTAHAIDSAFNRYTIK